MDHKQIQSRLSRLGIRQLLPMQQEMAEVSLPGKILLQAPTGSGKTIAFAIALLRRLKKAPGVQALVVAPTRELVLQIFDVVRPLAAPEFKTTAVYGGHSFETEAKSLSAEPNIVVGTPGRIIDHINRARLDLAGVKTLIVDEYDKALELGFADEMSRIFRQARRVETLVMTSATTGEIPAFAGKVDKVLDYSTANAVRPTIESFRIDSPIPDKLETLGNVLDALGSRRTIIFVNHRDAADRVYDYLRRRCGYEVCLYHGGLEQDRRERALILFENGSCHYMVATDLAARGLDIAEVAAVVHYHLPSSAEAWTHRNGRTARMGASGQAFTIVSEKDSVPDFIEADAIDIAEISPVADGVPMATLFFNAGKKEKISRGDIAGFMIAKGGLEPNEVGRIDVKDHYAYVAVPRAKARETAVALAPHKIKNTRVRVTQLKEQ